MFKRTSKGVASLLSISLILGNVAFAAASTTPVDSDKEEQGKGASQSVVTITDTANHWAKDAIERWSARGIVKGVSADKFEPNRSVTRSEWVSLLNRAFQLQTGKETKFTDVSSDKWYATDVSTAVYGEYIQGFTDGTFRPTATLSRAEAAVTVSKLLKLPATSSEVSFEDQASIKTWSKDFIQSVVEQGIISGYSNHTFQPNKPLTRAEAVSIVDRAVNYYGKWYGEAGTYGPASGVEKVNGSVVINSTNVTLQNTEVSGDLIVGKGVGSGDVYLKNIKVKGQVYVYGGGEHSIHLEDSVVVKIIVDKKDGSVRLVAEGNSSIQEITINTGATLDVSKGVSVDRVSLSENLPANSSVSLKGYFNTVNVEAYSIQLKLPEGSINKLSLSENAGNSTIETSRESSILSLILDAVARVTGLGSIKDTVVNSVGVSFEKKPENLKLGSNVPADTKISIGGTQAPVNTPQVSQTPPPVVSGGGSGGPSTVETSAPTAAPVPSATPVPTATPVPSATPGSGGTTEPSTPPLVWDFIAVEKQYVSVGDAVYFTPKYDYDVYLAGTSISSSKDTLDLAVASGEALVVHGKAGERNYFDTSLLKNVGFPNNYRFNIFGYQGDRYMAYSGVKILNEQVALQAPTVSTHMSDPEYFSLEYNRQIQLAEGQSLDNIVFIREEGKEYIPFTSAIGEVAVEGNAILIKPVAGLLEKGKYYNFKVIQGAVTTLNGEKNAYFESHEQKTITKLRLISPELGKDQYQVKIKAGDHLTFTVSDTTTVYLVPSGTSGTQDYFDKWVETKWGLKVVVDETKVDQALTMDTTGLPPGTYNLMAWFGTSVSVVITE